MARGPRAEASGIEAILQAGDGDLPTGAALAAIAAAPGPLRVTAEDAWRLHEALRRLRYTQDSESAAAILAKVNAALARDWPRHEAFLVTRAVGTYYGRADLLASYPVLEASRALAARLVDARIDRSHLAASPAEMATLGGDARLARRLVDAFLDQPKELAEVLPVARAWSGGERWVEVLEELSAPGSAGDDDEDFASLARLAPSVFPGGPAGRGVLARGPQVRAAWRRRLADAMEAEPGLLPARLEAICWATTEAMDDEVILLGSELDGAAVDLALEAIAAHPSPRAMLRARAIQHSRSPAKAPGAAGPGRPSVAEAIERIRPGGVPQPTGHARTWLGDPLAEDLVEALVDGEVDAFLATYPLTWGEDEEGHTAKLLSGIAGALRRADEHLEAVARASGASRRTKVSASYRLVPKREEGAAGVGESESFGADAAVVVEALHDGRSFASRATLVQAKKLEPTGSGKKHEAPATWQKSFKVPRPQRDDLVSQSPSSHYLFIGPPLEGRRLPCVPARLVAEIQDLGGADGVVEAREVAMAGRSLPQWLVEEVVGLRTGDWRPDVIEKARGRPGRRLIPLLEVTVELGHEVQS